MHPRPPGPTMRPFTSQPDPITLCLGGASRQNEGLAVSGTNRALTLAHLHAPSLTGTCGLASYEGCAEEAAAASSSQQQTATAVATPAASKQRPTRAAAVRL